MPIAAERTTYERGLIERIALVRTALAVANVGVIVLDRTIPLHTIEHATIKALVGCGAFLVYALVVRHLIRKHLISLRRYELFTPILDVLFISLLIVTTDGYVSPFSIWYIFAVVASGFSSYPQLPLVTTLLAMLAHMLIAIIPQSEPFDQQVFIIRSCFLFGFATTVAGIGSYITRQSESVRAIEDLGGRLSSTNGVDESCAAFGDSLRTALGVKGLRIGFDGQSPILVGDTTAKQIGSCALESNDEILGRVTLYRDTNLSQEDERLLRILSERFASAIRRHYLTQDLIESAGAEERLRLADRVHDGYIQTLAAVDLHAEAAKELGKTTPKSVLSELDIIKSLARTAASEAREFLLPAKSSTPPGLGSIAELFHERWGGPVELEVDRAVTLTEDQWDVISTMLREGINNAVKHGRSTQLRFIVSSEDNTSVVSLVSNGKSPGMPIDYGYGLTRLTRIVRDFGGALRLERRPGGGAILSVRFAKEKNK